MISLIQKFVHGEIINVSLHPKSAIESTLIKKAYLRLHKSSITECLTQPRGTRLPNNKFKKLTLPN